MLRLIKMYTGLCSRLEQKNEEIIFAYRMQQLDAFDIFIQYAHSLIS